MRWPSVRWIAVVLAFAMAAGVRAQSAAEYKLKAAFLYSFTRYVQWPASAFGGAGAPLVIGVLGRDPFDGELERSLDGKTSDGHPLVSRHPATADGVAGCHVVFVSADETGQLPALLAKLGTSPVLVIGEAEGFCGRGGTIELFLEDARIRFRINQANAARAGLTISSHLLRLAVLVK